MAKKVKPLPNSWKEKYTLVLVQNNKKNPYLHFLVTWNFKKEDILTVKAHHKHLN